MSAFKWFMSSASLHGGPVSGRRFVRRLDFLIDFFDGLGRGGMRLLLARLDLVLTCSKYQSGEIDRSGRISRCGDEIMRIMLYELYEAAQSMLRSKKWFQLTSSSRVDRPSL
jgi:Transposase IS116/IS110/IS902 family